MSCRLFLLLLLLCDSCFGYFSIFTLLLSILHHWSLLSRLLPMLCVSQFTSIFECDANTLQNNRTHLYEKYWTFFAVKQHFGISELKFRNFLVWLRGNTLKFIRFTHSNWINFRIEWTNRTFRIQIKLGAKTFIDKYIYTILNRNVVWYDMSERCYSPWAIVHLSEQGSMRSFRRFFFFCWLR